MSTLVLKGVPDSLRRELKHRAEEHRRSVNQEAIGILEMVLKTVKITAPKKVVKLKGGFDMQEAVKMIREGRE